MDCKWLLREVASVLIQYFGFLKCSGCLSLDSIAKTTIVHKDHAPLQCQEQICLWFVWGFFLWFSFLLALRRSSLQKTHLQVFRREEEGLLFKIY